MSIDWNDTPHYTMKFTTDGRSEMFDKDGALMPAHQDRTCTVVRVVEGKMPVIATQGPIESE